MLNRPFLKDLEKGDRDEWGKWIVIYPGKWTYSGYPYLKEEAFIYWMQGSGG